MFSIIGKTEFTAFNIGISYVSSMLLNKVIRPFAKPSEHQSKDFVLGENIYFLYVLNSVENAGANKNGPNIFTRQCVHSVYV